MARQAISRWKIKNSKHLNAIWSLIVKRVNFDWITEQNWRRTNRIVYIHFRCVVYCCNEPLDFFSVHHRNIGKIYLNHFKSSSIWCSDLWTAKNGAQKFVEKLFFWFKMLFWFEYASNAVQTGITFSDGSFSDFFYSIRWVENECCRNMFNVLYSVQCTSTAYYTAIMD